MLKITCKSSLQFKKRRFKRLRKIHWKKNMVSLSLKYGGRFFSEENFSWGDKAFLGKCMGGCSTWAD